MQEVKSSILSVSTMKEEDSVLRVFFDFPYEKGKACGILTYREEASETVLVSLQSAEKGLTKIR